MDDDDCSKTIYSALQEYVREKITAYSPSFRPVADGGLPYDLYVDFLEEVSARLGISTRGQRYAASGWLGRLYVDLSDKEAFSPPEMTVQEIETVLCKGEWPRSCFKP